jgi:MFS family permease
MTFPRKVLLSASLFHALNDAATVAIPMVFPLLYNLQFIIHDYTQIGLLSNFGLLTTFLFQILVVHFSHRFDYRSILASSFVGISLTLVLISFSSSYAFLFLLYLFFRVFGSFYHTLGLAWVSRTHPSHGIDLAMGIQSGSGNLGVFLAFISVGFLAQKFNWRLPLLFWSAICFLLGLVSFFLVKKLSFQTEGLGHLAFSSWRETFRRIRKYALGFVFGGACWSVTIYFAPSLLNHKFDIPLGKTGLYLAMWIGLGTVISYFFGHLSQKFGRSRIYQTAFIGASSSLVLLGAASKPLWAVLGLFLFGSFLFILYPALQSYVGNTVPSQNQHQAFSVVSNIQMISGAVMSLLAGVLSDRFGIASPFLVMGFLGLGASLFYFFSLVKLNSSKG